MKKNKLSIAFWVFLAATLWGVVVGCVPESSVGDSLRPDTDALIARVDSLPLSVRTVPVKSVYSRSTYTLLGEIVDPVYGNLQTAYISRLLCAPGFKFNHTPIDHKVDSVFVTISFLSSVGDTLAWSKANVYEVHQELPRDRYSGDLSRYVTDATLLGSRSYQPADSKEVHEIRVQVPNELGQRFYDASRNHPEYFASQDAFEKNLLRGFYVKTSTGSGCILSVHATELEIYYSHRVETKTKTGADTVYNKAALELFANTRQLYTHNEFKHTGINNLLAAQAPFAYIKAPAGVATELTIAAEDLARLYRGYLDSKGNVSLKRILNSAPLTVKVNLPEQSSRINPPIYLMLMPTDSLKSFFETNQTELTRPEEAYLSSGYSISSRYYKFDNIARLVDLHLNKHAHLDAAGKAVVDKDLKMILVPVQRSYLSGKQTTAAINNYIYPAAVRLHFPAEERFLVVSGSGYYVK